MGIDLGTDNSVAYYYQDGRIEAVVDQNGSSIIPSYVDFRNNGEIIVGATAKRNFANSVRSSNVIRGSKRIIGKKLYDPMVGFVSEYTSCPIGNVDGFPSFEIVPLGQRVTPRKVASQVVKRLLDLVMEKTGLPISRVCITVPAHFGNDERVETKKAVMALGIAEENIEIINEPTAAAIAYAVDNNISSTRVLVYDFGGGTFDVSILEVVNEELKVMKYGGNPRLGGADIDVIMLEWIQELYYRQYQVPLIPEGIDNEIRKRYMQRLLFHIEECKKNFQSSESVIFSMNFISPIKPLNANPDDDSFFFVLTLEEFNQRILQKVNETIDVVKNVMGEYGITKDNVDTILLVGGSSRLGLVRERLGEVFGFDKICEHVNPDLCVAKGACLHLIKQRIVKEIIAYSLDKTIINNQALCVIPSQTSLPAEFTVPTCTTHDNQTCVESFVLQGNQEKSNDVTPFNEQDFRKLAPYSFTGFEIRPAGAVAFDTTFKIEEDGIVYVTVVEEETGKKLLDHKEISYTV